MTWWKHATIYQIYPRSFQDANGDGTGDLRGVTKRLDYLKWLGVGAIWICPFYNSPMRDGGYDISDFCSVDPLFGSLADFDELLAAAHASGIRVILDFVPNHTSDQHPWFAESRSSLRNAKRDWYIWRDGEDDGAPPSNWMSNFGGSAWSYDEGTAQFYYHAFLPEQPDLNWRNSDVRHAMLDVLRFWLARGVDGFRVDAITNLVEDELLRDEPRGAAAQAGLTNLERVFTQDRPETHAFVAEMRATLDEHARDLVLIGEAHLPVARVVSYYGGERPGFHLPFNFLLLHTAWQARSIEGVVDRYMALLPEGAWPNWVLGNHDEPRLASRIGPKQARVAAMLTMTLKGTPFVYYGDELGLCNVQPVSSDGFNRDGSRAPMPWSAAPYGGFTTGVPWLSGAERAAPANVQTMQDDPRSILTLYKRLIALRQSEPALADGDYTALGCRGALLGFLRRSADREILVLLNVSGSAEVFKGDRSGEILLSTHLDRSGACGPDIELRGDEGLIVAVTRRIERQPGLGGFPSESSVRDPA